MSDGLIVGTRVRVTDSINRTTLPNGTTGTVVEIVDNYNDPNGDVALWFKADDDAELPFGSDLFGFGYPLFGNEVEKIA